MGAIALVALGVGLFFLLGKKGDEKIETTPVQERVAQTIATGSPDALRNLATQLEAQYPQVATDLRSAASQIETDIQVVSDTLQRSTQIIQQGSSQ